MNTNSTTNIDPRSHEFFSRTEKNGEWVERPHGRREWVWACGCHAATPDSFWVNSCSTHSLLNK